NQRFNIYEKDSILAISELSFDLSVYDIFGILAIGGSIIFPDQSRTKDIGYLKKLINDYKISIWNTVPQLAELLIDIPHDKNLNMNSLRLFLLSGDWIPLNLPGAIKAFLPMASIVSLGGATEGSIWSIWHVIHKVNSEMQSIPYGLAMPNQKMYILDIANKLCPIGAVGEIHIGGIGVALDYWNNVEKTNDSFYEHEELGRLYKTGDLGRWHPDGYMEFLGRKDTQIKLRGHRVELSEIEYVLNNYPEIKQSVVIVHGQIDNNRRMANNYLIGYYVAQTRLDEEAILSILKRKLPEYMIPLILVHIKRLPLTSNGKLDKNGLLNYLPEKNNIYIAPKSKLEKDICKAIAEILSLSPHSISVKDDFFKLGGNSILAIKLVNLLNHKLNMNIDIGIIFKYRNSYDLAQNLGKGSLKKLIIKEYVNLKKEEYKLSFAQERLWFINKFDESNTVYNVPMMFKLNLTCNIKILLSSLKDLVQRHEILRTVFKENPDGDLYQEVTSADLHIVEKSINNKVELHKHMKANAQYAFKLDKEIPIKVFHYIYAETHYLNILIHHIAFDGWSADILMRDLKGYYEYHSKLANKEYAILDLPKLKIQYKDFALWQTTYLTGKVLKNQLTYWKNKLNGHEHLNLPVDKLRPAVFDYQGKSYHFTFEQELSQNLRRVAKKLNISLYSLLLSGFYLILSTFSNQKDIVLGTLLSNRHYTEVENLVGFFVNILVLRKKINFEDSIITYIKQVSQEVLETQLHQDLPFEKLVEELDIGKDPSRHPLIQIIFGVQNFGTGNENLFTVYNSEYTNKTAKFDLSLLIDDKDEQLTGIVEYATSLFIDDTIERYIKIYGKILIQLTELCEDKNSKIKDISYINSATYKKLIKEYNYSEKISIPNKAIHELFEEQVASTPDNIAVVSGDIKLTYKVLNKKANKLAHYIKRYIQFKPETFIALCLDKNEHLVISILAVLKTGSVYIPIEPGYPNERINYILGDTNPKIILSNLIYREKLNQIINQCSNSKQLTNIAVDEPLLQRQLEALPDINLQVSLENTSLAYIIYTSGSTGKPKGVLQSHKNLVHLFTATNNQFKFNADDVWTLFHSYSFDFSVWEIWGALIYGGKLIIPTYEETHDLELFYQLCEKHCITVLNQTPSAFYQLMEIILNYDKLGDLRYIIFGGEALDATLLRRWIHRYGYDKPKIINMYGITETTVHVTYREITHEDIYSKPKIGKVISGRQAYILNDNLSPLPIGAIGELYVGGIGLARGYLNLPELTAKKFIHNIFQSKEEKQINENSYLYRTGDLVRRIKGGDLEYIGRSDTQVKLRGYRIELNEIEHVLNSYPGIKQSKALLLDHHDKFANNKYLVGYYVKDLDIKNKDITNYLKRWEKLYNSTYSVLNINEYKENIIGWNSSYTSESIPKCEMIEWRDETVKRIKSLNPNKILEIGSGSGLLLFNLIDVCEFYYATDFSSSSVNYTKKVIGNFKYQNKIKAIKCKADELPFEILKDNYDTVILNSVIQYFPTLTYLEKILSDLIDNISSLGQIFIGDVRDYRLLDCFYYSVLMFKNGKATLAELEYFKARDKELLISPEFFVYLQQINPHISNIQLLPKFGKAVNEMNCYRYDVILNINKTPDDSKYKHIDSKIFVKILNIDEYLSNKNEDYLYVKYPNQKIARDYMGSSALHKLAVDSEIKNIDELLNLYQLSQAFARQNYNVKFFLDIYDPLYINIVGYQRSRPKEELAINYGKMHLAKLSMVNQPVYNAKLFENQYNEPLMKYLESKLPDYMIPTYLILLNQMPLTVNGKLDYESLPKPEFILNDNYVAPRNDTDYKLCEIFAQILGLSISNIGIKSDFFKIGGNSLLAIKLLDKINKHFNCRLRLTNIFISKTIERLTQVILECRNKFELVTNLNNITNKLNLFMIHPGSSGSEVYITLALKLSNYSCYGVNNYNLYSKKKIDDIGQLANFYLTEINKVRQLTKQTKKPYVLLGWSLGAQIATEIANILEKKGYKDIRIIAIDAPIPDDKIAYYLSILKINEKKLYNNFSEQEYTQEYANKVITNFKYDANLAKQRKVNKLYHTKILVFKAMKEDIRVFVDNYDLLNSYELKLVYNNTDKITNLSNITLVNMDTVNHSNIIAKDILLANHISIWHNPD
ncbi:MAG: amino acid adenylation domain protein, partial [Burkholderiales bacterium]|nr:amino acid adenylation domain protein [Burkholderiales bacterium]